MTIATGERVPAGTFKTMTPEGPKDINAEELFSGKKVVLFGVPGAFTPTCHNKHLPGFLDNYDAFLAKGVDTVAVMAVNDVHVMGAWAGATGGRDKLTFLADGNGEFTKKVGLENDMSVRGMGLRCKRFSMLVEDGIVKSLQVETQPGQAIESSAARLLEQLETD